MKRRFKIPVARIGEFPHGDLLQIVDSFSLDAIVKNTNAALGKSGKLLIDFDHYSELPAEVKKAMSKLGVQLPTKAAGWAKELFREGDTVYANMESTPDGEEAIVSESYAKTSPTFRLIDCSSLGTRNGKKLIRPLKVKSVALCNKPNMESLGTILANRATIENKEDDLQNVFLGSAMAIFEKEKIMENEKTIENAEAPVQETPVAEEVKEEVVETAVEEAKTEAVAEVVEAVAVAAEASGASPETVQAVAEATETAVEEAVEVVAEAVEAPKAEEAVENSVDPKDARILELEAKVNELQAVIDEAGKARQEAELKNRIAEELSKYPSLCNREEAEELLRKDWDLGSKFLAS